MIPLTDDIHAVLLTLGTKVHYVKSRRRFDTSHSNGNDSPKENKKKREEVVPWHIIAFILDILSRNRTLWFGVIGTRSLLHDVTLDAPASFSIRSGDVGGKGASIMIRSPSTETGLHDEEYSWYGKSCSLGLCSYWVCRYLQYRLRVSEFNLHAFS